MSRQRRMLIFEIVDKYYERDKYRQPRKVAVKTSQRDCEAKNYQTSLEIRIYTIQGMKAEFFTPSL